jgi:4'-phosphopantetheinyl transferase
MQLAENEIHLWLTHCFDERQHQTVLDEYHTLLSPDEAQRKQRFHFAADRQRHLIARALVRHTLSRYAPVVPSAWCFAKGAHDKPEIVDPPLPLRFNLSHSGDWAICAVALVDDVGVDIECTTRVNDILSIARHYFSPIELHNLDGLPTELARERFFDLWTLKESFMKARGEGISLGLNNFSFEFGTAHDEQPTSIGVQFAEVLRDEPLDWQFWLSIPAPSYRLALAWHRPPALGIPRIRLFYTLPGHQLNERPWLPSRATALC